MFRSFKKMGDEIITLINPADSVALVAGFQSIIVTWATIYILYIAYMSLLGKIDNPVRQVIYKLLMFMFISLFAFNAGPWYTYAINAINGLVGWISAGGTDVLFTKLDNGLKLIANISQVYTDNDSSSFEVKSIIGTAVIYVSYFSVALLTSILLVLNVISLQIIFVLAPFAFLSLFFPYVRGIFDRWIELIISNIFTIFFISLFFNAIYDKYETILKNLDPITVTHVGFIYDTTDVDIFLSAFTILAFSVLAFMLLLMSTGLAFKLSTVSIEKIPTSAAISTAATGYVAGKTIKSAASSISKGSKKIVGGISGVSRKAGSVGSSNAQSLLKKRGKGGGGRGGGKK